MINGERRCDVDDGRTNEGGREREIDRRAHFFGAPVVAAKESRRDIRISCACDGVDAR
jgi:hypothetical protein